MAEQAGLGADTIVAKNQADELCYAAPAYLGG
mgnify:FL=1